MFRKLKEVTLKNGEKAELGVVLGPDIEWGKKVRHLLGHKGENWRWQIEQNLENAESGTESFFYILSKKGIPFAQIMTIENYGIGVFGHVYTTPEERKKGAADLIHHYQMEDFRARKGRALYLGTNYDTHPYRLYRKYGFVGCEPESGSMYYFAQGQQAFESEVFAAGPAVLERFAFKHWPLLPALAMMDHPAKIRLLGMGVVKISSTEGGALPYLIAAAKNDPQWDAYVAVSQSSKVPVAIACRRPEAYFGHRVDLVDVFAAPHHENQIPKLMEALKLGRQRKAVCYADDAWPSKVELLKKAGFRQEGTLRRHLLSQTKQCHDVTLWSLE